MPLRIDVLSKRVAQEKERRVEEQRRRSVSWEPKPLWIWCAWWSFVWRYPGGHTISIDAAGWHNLVRAMGGAPTDEAALEVLLTWAGRDYCGLVTRHAFVTDAGCEHRDIETCAVWGDKSYHLLRDVVVEQRIRNGQSLAVPLTPNEAVIQEGRALVLVELSADRVSGEIHRSDPYERFFEQGGAA